VRRQWIGKVVLKFPYIKDAVSGSGWLGRSWVHDFDGN